MANVEQVRVWLDPEEPDYPGAARALGPAALPAITELVKGMDLALASKATYLASLIPHPEAVVALRAAQARVEPQMRVAAASGIRNLDAASGEAMFESLHRDPDPGVRKVALRSAAALNAPAVLQRLRTLAESDPEPTLRDLATTLLRTANPPG